MHSSSYQKVARSEHDARESHASNDLEEQSRKPQQTKRYKKYILLIGGILFAQAIGLLIWFVVKALGSHSHQNGLSLTELRNGTYSQTVSPIQWLPNGKDGELVQRTGEGYSLSHWESQNDSKIIAPLTFSDSDGSTHFIQNFQLNQQRTHAIVASQIEKHWRHSSFSKFWIMNLQTSETIPLNEEALSVATWSPDGELVAYVLNNNVYVHNVAQHRTRQVTYDGGADIFNGIPDWVYEEEVFSGDSALWWSPESHYLAFMKTNDSLVPKFPIQYFLSAVSKSEKGTNSAAYPELVELKYPKPGFANPVVSLWIYSVIKKSTNLVNIPTSLNEPIISEVVWVGEHAVVKISSRESDFLEVWVVDPQTSKSQRSRSYSSKDLGGSWFEVTHNSHAVGSEGYVDTIDVDGYNHLGFFSPANSSEPVVLTRGEWEVQDTVISVNTKTRHVYFHATKRSSMEISLYRVSLDHPEQEPELVAFEGEGVYRAVFSADASFATVTYTSPFAPLIQKVVKLSENLPDNTEASEWRIEENRRLDELLKSRKILDPSNVVYGTVDVGNGTEVNYREIRPSNFNPHKKHKLLFFNYGGPGSQQVLKQLSIDFQRVFAETHNAVILTVDPRGTGNRGRKFRASVRDHLGDFEADDVISVAKIWNEKSYIDSDTTAIWGWSYGGFLTLKVLERDVDLAFKYGIAVAPVTDWSLYDSIYTERYMHKPENNMHGYETTRINNVTNIANHKRFLVMHGTGDDNVHFQNTLRLLDKLDLSGVENYDVHVFPDSDHSIYFHNANTIVYDKIDQWLASYQKPLGKN